MIEKEPINKDKQAYIEINRKDLSKLKREYRRALEANQETFVFKDCVLLVKYAKYLIQYVETTINRK